MILTHHFSFLDLLDLINKYSDSLGLFIVLLLFVIERNYSRQSRRKDAFLNWYLNFVIGKNIESLDSFFLNVEDEIIKKVPGISGEIENSQSVLKLKLDLISKFDSLKQKVNFNFFNLLSSIDTGLFNSCIIILNDIDDQVKVYVDSKVGAGNDIEFDLNKFFGYKNKIYELLYKPIQSLN